MALFRFLFITNKSRFSGSILGMVSPDVAINTVLPIQFFIAHLITQPLSIVIICIQIFSLWSKIETTVIKVEYSLHYEKVELWYTCFSSLL